MVVLFGSFLEIFIYDLMILCYLDFVYIISNFLDFVYKLDIWINCLKVDVENC